MKFGKQNTMSDLEQKKKDQEEMDEKYGLPDTWARHTQKRTK